MLKKPDNKSKKKFENDTETRFHFWSSAAGVFAFLLTFGAMIGFGAAALTLTLIAKALIVAALVFVAVKAVSLCLLVGRRIYLEDAQAIYTMTKLDNIRDPAEIEALQMGAKATNHWHYAKSYVQMPAYKHYKAFLGGYAPAMKGDEEMVDKIKGLRAR